MRWESEGTAPRRSGHVGATGVHGTDRKSLSATPSSQLNVFENLDVDLATDRSMWRCGPRGQHYYTFHIPRTWTCQDGGNGSVHALRPQRPWAWAHVQAWLCQALQREEFDAAFVVPYCEVATS